LDTVTGRIYPFWRGLAGEIDWGREDLGSVPFAVLAAYSKASKAKKVAGYS
jgi:hypothetical protein